MHMLAFILLSKYLTKVSERHGGEEVRQADIVHREGLDSY